MLPRTSDNMASAYVEDGPVRHAGGSFEDTTQSPGRRAERLRVLHVFNHLGMGGTELTALRVIANLGNDEFEHVLCPLKGCDSELVARRSPGSQVVIPAGGSNGFQFMTPRLAKVMKEVKPHIVHSRNRGAVEALPAARLAGVPIAIHSEHGYEITNVQGLPLKQRLLRRAVYPLADALVTVSHELRTYHARQAWISADRIRVIENGIDTQLFAPKRGMLASFREEIGIPQNRFVVGTVGRVVAIKGQKVLLKAIELLANRGVDIHAVIAGTGPELDALRQSVAESPVMSGRVSFVGAVQNVCEILNAMDTFVLPSLSEGMSNTLIEAMACGLPVLASRVGGNPEVVEENCSGLLFEPGDAEGISNLLYGLWSDPDRREILGIQARRRAVERFEMARMVEDYRKLYRGLARKRGILTGGVS